MSPAGRCRRRRRCARRHRESPMQAAGAHCVPEASGEHWPTLPATLQRQARSRCRPSRSTRLAARRSPRCSRSVWRTAGRACACRSCRPCRPAGGAQPFAGGVQLVAQAVALPQRVGRARDRRRADARAFAVAGGREVTDRRCRCAAAERAGAVQPAVAPAVAQAVLAAGRRIGLTQPADADRCRPAAETQ